MTIISNRYCSPLIASFKVVMLFVAVIVFILSDHSSWSWIIIPTSSSTVTVGRRMLVLAGNGNNDGKPDDTEEHVHLGLDPQNPCWQDIADEDCALSTAYSASFIAKDWIQSMPCAEGIADCDMPEVTTHPGHEGVEDVDVMEFLGIQRAKGVMQVRKGDVEEEKP